MCLGTIEYFIGLARFAEILLTYALLFFSYVLILLILEKASIFLKHTYLNVSHSIYSCA